MKTKQQKKEELKKAEDMLGSSQAVIFTDFSRLDAEEMRALRGELRVLGAKLLVIKKRLINVLFKEKGIDYDPTQFESWVGTIFSPTSAEEVGGPLYRFFKDLDIGAEGEKIDATKKILGGYDLDSGTAISQETLFMIGQLPPREVLLAQLLGVLTGPIRALMYLLNEKGNQSEEATPESSDTDENKSSNDASSDTDDGNTDEEKTEEASEVVSEEAEASEHKEEPSENDDKEQGQEEKPEEK